MSIYYFYGRLFDTHKNDKTWENVQKVVQICMNFCFGRYTVVPQYLTNLILKQSFLHFDIWASQNSAITFVMDICKIFCNNHSTYLFGYKRCLYNWQPDTYWDTTVLNCYKVVPPTPDIPPVVIEGVIVGLPPAYTNRGVDVGVGNTVWAVSYDRSLL